MRKDIKRSLLLWPLLASASITAAGFMQSGLPSLRQEVSAVMASWFPRETLDTLPLDLRRWDPNRIAMSPYDGSLSGLAMIEKSGQ